MTTESALRDWRYGQTQAERLVAALLHLEGFEAVDPQHPLGGPDGLKDVLCRKDGLSWIAAAYFPTTPPTLSKIKSKFGDDFKGVKKNNARAFAFFINQPLTVDERQKIRALAGQTPVELYHVERIRSLLDAPKGCGIRLEYLRIAMTEAEQWAFWNSMNQDVVRKLLDHEARLDAQMRSVDEKLALILERTRSIDVALTEGPSHLGKAGFASENIEMPTASLSLTTLCWLHRVITEKGEFPEAVRGHLRSISVWIGAHGSSPDTATYTPPLPQEIIKLTTLWIEWWKSKHFSLRSKNKDEVIAALAEFHHRFLWIHPFLDANGRLARILLDQASRELLNQGVSDEFTNDVAAYYAALAAADKGDFTSLRSRIAAALK